MQVLFHMSRGINHLVHSYRLWVRPCPCIRLSLWCICPEEHSGTLIFLAGNMTMSLGNTCHYWQFQKVSIELLTNGSYNHTFLCGWNCRPEAVLWTSNKTADQRQVYGHFSVYRAIFSTFFTKLLTMAVLWTLFGVLRYLTCGHVAKTADHGSSMDSFRPSSANCWPMAGLWTLFGPLKSCQQNCWP